jgi:hypothetical protein
MHICIPSHVKSTGPGEFISIDWFPYMNCNSVKSLKWFHVAFIFFIHCRLAWSPICLCSFQQHCCHCQAKHKNSVRNWQESRKRLAPRLQLDLSANKILFYFSHIQCLSPSSRDGHDRLRWGVAACDDPAPRGSEWECDGGWTVLSIRCPTHRGSSYAAVPGSASDHSGGSCSHSRTHHTPCTSHSHSCTEDSRYCFCQYSFSFDTFINCDV